MTTIQVCAPCEHVAEHGWWGPGRQGTHCRDCHRTWTGKTEAHCAACCEHFGSPRPFDIHLEHCTRDATNARGTYRSVMRIDGNPRLVLQERKSGPTWIEWDSREHPFA